MKEQIHEWVERSLRDAEKRRCVDRVLSIDRSSVVAKGDNYTSELSRLRLKVQLKSGELEERSVIYKSLPSTELMRNYIGETGLFLIEKRMYTEVLPQLERIRREKETGEPLWGECYAATNSEMLLEDLAVHGYKMGDRMKGLDFEHSKLVMKSLAKFHALAAVLKQRGELVVRDFDKHFVQRNTEMMGAFYRSSFEGLADVIEKEWKGEWLPFADRLRKKAVTVLDDLIADLSTNNCKFLTLNHGDCWVNNMLFKYDDEGRPVSVRFIDFQVAFYNGSGYDLENFFSSSISEALRYRKDDLIRIYHDHLVDCLETYGYGAPLPTLDDIKSDVRKALLFGLVDSVTLLPVMMMPASRPPTFQEESDKFLDFVVNDSQEYLSAVRFILGESQESGIL